MVGMAESGERTNVPELSVVVPVYCNEGSLLELYGRLEATLASSTASWEVVFVNDGSTDGSAAVLDQLLAQHRNVRVVNLSRNFGAIPAVTAGMAQARGRAVAVISADLQEPPELLPRLLDSWRSGDRVVLATRRSRADPWTTRLFAAIFYFLFRSLVSKDMPKGGFDFFLLDRKVVQAVLASSEKNSNLSAMILWLGFQRTVVEYDRVARRHGRSKWTFAKKLKLVYDSLFSFSYVPLRIVTGFGLLGMVLSVGYGLTVLVYRVRHPGEPPGWASLMVVTLFFDGVLLASLGVVGEYVWRSLDAARGRPPFVIDEVRSSATNAGGSSDKEVARAGGT